MTSKALQLLAYVFACPPIAHVRPVWGFHPKWSKDTTGGERWLFWANLASVPLRHLRSKPLPTRNIITVQDKGRWSL